MSEESELEKSLSFMENQIKILTSCTIEVGILGDGSVKGKGESEIVVYATALEFGTSKMKPFGFIRRSLDMTSEIQVALEKAITGVMELRLTGIEGAKMIGETIRSIIVREIINSKNWARKNTSSYEAWKKKNYPNRAGQTLILEGNLVRSIRYRVKRDGGVVFTSRNKSM